MPTRSEMLVQAEALIDQGIGVIPLRYKAKAPMVPWRVWQNRIPPKALVRMWLQKKWPCNLGVLVDRHLVVLDFDEELAYRRWTVNYSTAAQSCTVQTYRGWHVYLYVEQPPGCTLPMTGGECKNNGYVVAPPSVHESGWQYQLVHGQELVHVSTLETVGVHVKRQSPPEQAPQADARLIETPIQRIKRSIGVAEFLGRYTELVERWDGTLLALCPFHPDTKPSLQVWPNENRCYCHSPACRAHRKCDVITCAQFLYEIELREAIYLLLGEIG